MSRRRSVQPRRVDTPFSLVRHHTLVRHSRRGLRKPDRKSMPQTKIQKIYIFKSRIHGAFYFDEKTKEDTGHDGEPGLPPPPQRGEHRRVRPQQQRRGVGRTSLPLPHALFQISFKNELKHLSRFKVQGQMFKDQGQMFKDQGSMFKDQGSSSPSPPTEDVGVDGNTFQQYSTTSMSASLTGAPPGMLLRHSSRGSEWKYHS